MRQKPTYSGAEQMMERSSGRMAHARRQRSAGTAWAVGLGLLAAAGLLGCDSESSAGGGGADTSGADTSGADTGGSTDVSQGTDAAAVTDCVAPTSGLGTSTGSKFDSSITLLDCDGNPVRLSDAMCGHRLTVIDIGAGWCQPCRESAEELEEKLVQPFSAKGLQVISILFQDDNGQPAVASFCKDWRDQFGLTTPVLIDPGFQTKKYFDAFQQAAPITFLVNEEGTIVHAESGVPATNLDQTVAAELDK